MGSAGLAIGGRSALGVAVRAAVLDRAGGLGREREVVLLLDRSASMAAGSTGATAFDKAKLQAGEVLKNLPGGAAAHAAYFDAGGVTPVEVAEIDRAARAGLAGTDFTQALAWARDIMVGSRRMSRTVYLWTDLQRSGMGDPVAESFPPGVNVEIIDVGRALTTNIAVEDVAAEKTDLRAGNIVSIAARVFNAGLFPVQDVRVKLSLDGLAPIEKTIALEGHSRRVVRFEVPKSEPRLYHGSVEVAGGDDLPFDDRRWLAFRAPRFRSHLAGRRRAGTVGLHQRDVLHGDGASARAAR